MIIPFAFFGFWATTLAVGAAAASIPIIIHLLNRRRYQIVTWAAMRFLLNAQKKNTKRMRLEQLLLLAVRVLLVVLLVLAMASVMPWAESVWATLWPGGAGFYKIRTSRIHKIIVLDGSLSMAARYDAEKRSFDRARELAIQIVREAQAGDAFSVLLMKNRPQWIVAGVSTSTSDVIKAIRDAKQTHGNADVPTTLKEVAEKLGESPSRFRTRQVYFLTDMQKSTWLPNRPTDKEGPEAAVLVQGHLQQIQKKAQSIFVNVHRNNANNVAVTDLALDRSLITTESNISVTATLKNFGLAVHQNLQVELRIGKARDNPADPPFKMNVAREMRTAIKPGETKSITLQHKFSKPGSYALQVRISGDDLEPDNSRTMIVTVRDTVPVLLVNGQPEANKFDTATEYLRRALNPWPGDLTPHFMPFRPKVISTSQFANASEINLANYDCIFLCNVGQLSGGQIRRLETHLRRGGGVVISMGDEAADHLKMYNDFLYKGGSGLLPARLIGTEQAPPDYYFALDADQETRDKPPLKAFAGAGGNALWNVRLQRYVRSEIADARAARIILSLVPRLQPNAKSLEGKNLPVGDPLLIEWNPPLPKEQREKQQPNLPGRPRETPRYRGKVVLMTSTWNMDWTTWPGSTSYLPLVQELTRLAISGRLRGHSSVVGTPLEEVLLSNGTQFNVTLHLPDGSMRNLTTTGRGEITVFRWPHTGRSGIYRMTVGHGVRDYLFAINVPTSIAQSSSCESELFAAQKMEMEKTYPTWKFQIVQQLGEVQHRTITEHGEEVLLQAKLGPELARYVLYIVVVLLWLEVILACVFGHFTTVPGAGSGPVKGSRLWPIGVAVAAGLSFVVIAGVLFHAVRAGDFLGFLPGSVRSGIESMAGIPAPPSGEGRKWEPEFSAYFMDSGTDFWLAGFMLAAYGVALFFVYRKEGANIPPAYKTLLGGLRWFLMFLALAVWLPQLQVNFKRESWPDVIVLIDDSLSMGETDQYQDSKLVKTIDQLGEKIRERLADQLPQQIKDLKQRVDVARRNEGPNSGTTPGELKILEKKLAFLESQLSQLNSQSWRPNRLQLAQAMVLDENHDLLQSLLGQRQMKVHVYHLDAVGKALRLSDPAGKPIAITALGQSEELEKAHKAVAMLEPYATDSQLGTAVRQVLDHFGGSSVSAVIVLSDGITTSAEDKSGYEKNLAKVSEYALLKGVPMFLVGIGDDHELRDLRLHDLQVVDTVYVNDNVIFEARLTGKGFKNLTVPVVLKVREPDGTETEVDKKNIKVDPQGKPVQIQLKHQPTKPGEKLYIVEVIPPKKSREDREEFSNLRLQRTVFVQEAKPIKILLVEGSARYEYRFLKALLEREKRDAKGNRSIEVKVLLVDSDPGFAGEQDRNNSVIPVFPFNRAELDQYDVIILGDVDPHSPKLGDDKLRMIVDFVREKGGGLLMVAGPLYSPHAYRKTPLADVLPVEPERRPPAEPAQRTRGYRIVLTPVGQLHPIFRLSPNHGDNLAIWNNLAPMYWWSGAYRIKPAAEVLAVHPKQIGAGRPGKGKDDRLPLVVQQFVGAGRSMFFGFEESWRWRWRDDEIYYNKFWIETVRYLSRNRVSHTKLFLDRQTPYRQGEKIKVSVRFPDNTPIPGQLEQNKAGINTNVKVMVKYQADVKSKGPVDVEPDSLELAKVEGSWSTYEGYYPATRKGKYQFWLSTPDVSALQPNKKQPSAEAVVVLPPGELDLLRMNREEMEKAAAISGGRFYTIATADQLLDDLPSGYRVLLNSEGKPWLLWNHALCFLLALAILTSEWLLRKRRHLL